MPLLPAFHDAVKTAEQMANASILGDENDNLSYKQKLLLRWHYRIGHLGFQHLQWLGRAGIFDLAGQQFGSTTVIPPRCEDCILGSHERCPKEGTTVIQKNKGKLKAEQLTPGQSVFAD